MMKIILWYLIPSILHPYVNIYKYFTQISINVLWNEWKLVSCIYLKYLKWYGGLSCPLVGSFSFACGLSYRHWERLINHEFAVCFVWEEQEINLYLSLWQTNNSESEGNRIWHRFSCGLDWLWCLNEWMNGTWLNWMSSLIQMKMENARLKPNTT